VKVLDFGLAKATREAPLEGGLTNPGQALGTPDYMAPEQIRDAQKADIRADIYSLGCTLYYLLSESPPFRAENLWDLYQAHHSMDAKQLNFVRPEVPSELTALVAKMMAKDADRRFQTPAEVAQALTPFFKKGGVASGVSKVEVSQVGGHPETKPASAGAGSVPTQPATGMAPAPASPTKKPAEKGRSEAKWDSLIEFKKTEPLNEPAPNVAALKRQRPPWIWPAIVAAAVLGLITMGIIIYVTTDDGRVRIVVDDPKAVVQVDGKEILIKTLRESITLHAGEHEMTVKWHDGELETRKFVVRRGHNEKLRVEYEPSLAIAQ
jgi:hypothetical protein